MRPVPRPAARRSARPVATCQEASGGSSQLRIGDVLLSVDGMPCCGLDDTLLALHASRRDTPFIELEVATALQPASTRHVDL